MGVFATRATHRPNGIGQSVVKLDKVEAHRLFISGIDLLDGTPILDIKPYVPYADIPEASNSIASAAPQLIDVQWTDAALQQAHGHAQRLDEPLVELIEQCLAQDPRPAYQTPAPEREYGAQFWDLDVRWHYPTPEQICVLEVIRPTWIRRSCRRLRSLILPFQDQKIAACNAPVAGRKKIFRA
jgi:hypothetical protein